MKSIFRYSSLCLIAALLLTACGSKERSSATGWNYNDTKWGGFEKLDYKGQIAGPNLVLVEGGTFTMGHTQEDVQFDWNAIPRRVTVSSFYIDETEVRNIDYLEYLYWLRRVVGESYPEVVVDALPDTLVWREELAFNEPLVQNYLRHPSYNDYPVVGVTWEQANDFCIWRTDRVNEMLLVENGILNLTTEQKDDDNFNTGSYLKGQYEGDVRKNLKDLQTGGERKVRWEDGILLPDYRLPTEAEWEYAALALRGNLESPKGELITDRRNYPWDGKSPRYQKRDRYQGRMLANYKRSAGDYMGTAGNLNDAAAPTAPVKTYPPNDFGIYDMAGNVNEWVLDVYRPMTPITLADAENHDFNSFRGNHFRELERNEDGEVVEKDSLGRLRYRYVTDEEVKDRENYKRGKVYDYMDGDQESKAFYDYGTHTLISDKARVYKGGSWSDRLYWLSPGTRRFKNQDKADRSIGFRCAMIRMGEPVEESNQAAFKQPRKRKRRFK